MIKTIELKNFKGFVDEEIELSPLTVLAGRNGMGKSTLCQALLWIRQNFQAGLLTPERKPIALNGPLVRLGLAEDVLNKYYQGDRQMRVSFCFEDEDTREKATASYQFPISDWRKEYLEWSGDDKAARVFGVLYKPNFYYISAERLGPQNEYPASYQVVEREQSVGIRGEYAVHFLHIYQAQTAAFSNLLFPGTTITPSLLAQTNAWLSALRPNIRAETKYIPEFNSFALSYYFLQAGYGWEGPHRPHNVGFGLSYTLPLFVAVLGAKSPSFFIVENPEAHLHPAGQVLLGRFLALAAAAGHQILLETHSDHVLNGVRVAVKEKQISDEAVKLLFFNQQDGERPTLYAETVGLLSNGKLTGRPTDFFDEFDKQLSNLI